MRKMKRVEDSRTENTYLIMNKHINSYGRLFGGVLMQWIDEMAGIVAHRHAGTIVTTACVDNLNFKAGAYLGNTVVLIGKMTYVGRTSMEVRIDTYVEDSDGMRKMINRAYEVMVALDENDNKVEVPGLIVETEAEKADLRHVTAFYMQEMLTGRKSLTSSGILAVFMSCVEIMTVTGPKSFQLHCDLK